MSNLLHPSSLKTSISEWVIFLPFFLCVCVKVLFWKISGTFTEKWGKWGFAQLDQEIKGSIYFSMTVRKDEVLRQCKNCRIEAEKVKAFELILYWFFNDVDCLLPRTERRGLLKTVLDFFFLAISILRHSSQ